MLHRSVNAVAKRVPAHAKDRAEEALFGLRDFERLSLPSQSALTVVCDDGEVKNLDVVEVRDKHGGYGVFAISPDFVWRPGFLSYQELRGIRERGHEIAFHGTTHDPFTGFANQTELAQSVERGLLQLESEGLGKPA